MKLPSLKNELQKLSLSFSDTLMCALLKRKKAFDFVCAFVENLIKIELLKQKCGICMHARKVSLSAHRHSASRRARIHKLVIDSSFHDGRSASQLHGVKMTNS